MHQYCSHILCNEGSIQEVGVQNIISPQLDILSDKLSPVGSLEGIFFVAGQGRVGIVSGSAWSKDLRIGSECGSRGGLGVLWFHLELSL